MCSLMIFLNFSSWGYRNLISSSLSKKATVILQLAIILARFEMFFDQSYKILWRNLHFAVITCALLEAFTGVSQAFFQIHPVRVVEPKVFKS
jgi:hypothetical protein